MSASYKIIFAAVCMLLVFPSVSSAQDIDNRLDVLEKENKQLKGLIHKLQERIESLESITETIETEEAKEPESLEVRVETIEKALEERDEGWLPSLKGKRFKLGGELEFEYVDTERDAETGKPSGRFQIDKFTLKPHIQIADDIILEGLLLFKPSKAYLSEAYVIFSNLPLDSSLKIGLDDRFINGKPGRKTESFSLTDSVFARDDELGIAWSGKQGSFYWVLSLSNGFELGQQAPSEDASYKMIHDNKQISDANQNKEVGLGLGWKHTFSKSHMIDILGFGYNAKLSQDDIAFLQGITGYGTSGDDTNNMYGASIGYKLKGLSFGGKYIRARDGVLDRYGWFTQTSYKIRLGKRKHFTSIEPLIRYGRLNVDIPHDPGDSLTWDRQMTTIALLTEIAKNVMLKIEYYLNDETTGGADVNNDEFLMQLEVKF